MKNHLTITSSGSKKQSDEKQACLSSPLPLCEDRQVRPFSPLPFGERVRVRGDKKMREKGR
jgi:hypothetical protein